jgi:hypothetical protein
MDSLFQKTSPRKRDKQLQGMTQDTFSKLLGDAPVFQELKNYFYGSFLQDLAGVYSYPSFTTQHVIDWQCFSDFSPKEETNLSTASKQKDQVNTTISTKALNDDHALPEVEAFSFPPPILTIKEGEFHELYQEVFHLSNQVSISPLTDLSWTCLTRLTNWIQRTGRMSELVPLDLDSSLNDYEKMRIHLSIQEAKDHIFLGSCGFEVFLKACTQQQFVTLASIVPMLILDWHIQAEQPRAATYLQQTGKLSQFHHLPGLSQSIGEWDALPDSLHQYLKDFKMALIWSRYPHSIHVRKEEEKVLNWILFSLEWTQNIYTSKDKIQETDINHLLNLIKFIFQSHLNSIHLLVYRRLTDPSIQDSINLLTSLFQSLENKFKQEFVGLIGESWSTLRPSHPKSSIQKALQENWEWIHHSIEEARLKPSIVKMDFGNPLIPLKEAASHLMRVETALLLSELYPDSHLDAWHLRNCLNFQLVFENILISQGIMEDLGFIQTHDFALLMEVLEPAKWHSQDTSLTHELFMKFNLHLGIHYPRQVLKNRPHLFLQTLVQATKQSQQLLQEQEGFKKVEVKQQSSFINIQEEIQKICLIGSSESSKKVNKALGQLTRIKMQLTRRRSLSN